jgi:PAS domain S-box-containing protein
VDPRFKKINRILTDYALGNFGKKMRLSSKLDEIDGFIYCVNMLGEELKETTISKNHFNNIFNSVSDMIFVLDAKGKIQNTSQSVHDILKYDDRHFRNKFIDTLEVKREHSLFGFIKKKLKTNRFPIEVETAFKDSEGVIVPVLSSTVFLYNEKGIKIGYLTVAKDLTHIKEYELSLKESEEKYRKIFEESTDCIFIADRVGNFLDINKAGCLLFKTTTTPSKTLPNLIYKKEDKQHFTTALNEKKNINNFFTQLKCFDESVIDCLLSITPIISNKKLVGYRGIIKDVSKQKQTEKLILKTIVHTQEEERKRFAKDIHDSLGQQLSAIKFYIGTTVAASTDAMQKKLLTKANDALVVTLSDMRNICFNLMPKTLEHFGLAASIKELCKQIEVNQKLMFSLSLQNDFPLLNKQLEISLFRVVQEFINNSLKHSNANKIQIQLTQKNNTATVKLKDNGKGFVVTDGYKKNGMGLTNVQSRVSPYNGDVVITSSPGNGVTYKITIPLTKENLNTK